MAVSLEAEGTANPVMDVELSLRIISTIGSYRLVLDLDEMVNDDVLIVRVKTEVLAADSRAIIESVRYADDQGVETQLIRSTWYVVVDASHSLEFTIEQTDGAAVRDFKWQIAKF